MHCQLALAPVAVVSSYVSATRHRSALTDLTGGYRPLRMDAMSFSSASFITLFPASGEGIDADFLRVRSKSLSTGGGDMLTRSDCRGCLGVLVLGAIDAAALARLDGSAFCCCSLSVGGLELGLEEELVRECDALPCLRLVDSESVVKFIFECFLSIWLVPSSLALISLSPTSRHTSLHLWRRRNALMPVVPRLPVPKPCPLSV
mmetsp:Transcript_4520/g.8826  ORF Transcript_4520/g.8826 Transcript_4520/m.8826 type:complete len:204 (-) Transcript_4520:727-1338(-)